MATRDIVRTTTEAAFLLDSACRIVEWNESAEELLGHVASKVVGSFCWEILQGTDVFGNTFCSSKCPLRQMASQRKAVHPCELYVRQASGDYRRVRMSTLVLGPEEANGSETVHILDPMVGSVEEHESTHLKLSRKLPHGELTPREMEVLKHLAAGKPTDSIASALGISSATVRNHTCHILYKLSAHTRLEAVAKSRQLGILKRS